MSYTRPVPTQLGRHQLDKADNRETLELRNMDSEEYNHPIPESPSTATYAADEFTAHDADLVLRACDGREFRVYRRFLMEASSVFHAMFSIPAPPPGIQATTNVGGLGGTKNMGLVSGKGGVGNTGTGANNVGGDSAIPIVDIAEDSFVFSTLLRFIYPVPEPQITTLASLSLILKAAEKYAMDGTLHSLRRILISPQSGFLDNSPLHVYALAMMYGFKEESQMASNRAIMNVDFLQLELDQHHGMFFEKRLYVTKPNDLTTPQQSFLSSRAKISCPSSKCNKSISTSLSLYSPLPASQAPVRAVVVLHTGGVSGSNVPRRNSRNDPHPKLSFPPGSWLEAFKVLVSRALRAHARTLSAKRWMADDRGG